MMEAQPELALVAKALNENSLEAILIGNMAAALHGAQAVTINFDLFFQKTPQNMRKLELVADALEAVVLRPYYPASRVTRLRRVRDGLPINFITRISGEKFFGGVRARADVHFISGQRLLAAHPDDIIRISRAAKKSAALKRESDRALIELIRYRLSLPPEKRLNCLLRKIGLRATCL